MADNTINNNVWHSVLSFVKNWTLPISILTGILAYIITARLSLSTATKLNILHFTELVQPLLIFMMLFVSFCKIKPSDLKPRIWHLYLLVTQCILFAAITYVLWLYPDTSFRLMLESAMLAFLCPTATACAVVTQKLGGNSGTTTTYTIFINLIIAVLAPLLLPIAHPREGLSFFLAFLTITKKVFPILMLPLFMAWTVRYFLPNLVDRIIRVKDLAFYMWAFSLSIAIAVSCRAVANSNESILHLAAIGGATLVACVFQFGFGKWIGSHYGMRIEGGQALGQKNTVFIIWLGYTFLSPVSAIAGGFYSIWHNVINSWQLYRYRVQNER